MKADRLEHHSSLGCRVKKKEKEEKFKFDNRPDEIREPGWTARHIDEQGHFPLQS